MNTTMTLEEKKELYTRHIHSLREDKIAETRKKRDVEGLRDEDDYHYLAPPAGWDWKPTPNHPNGEFYGYTAWAENYRDMVASFPPVVNPRSSMAGNFFSILHRFRREQFPPEWDLSDLQENIDRYHIDHGLGGVHHFCGDVRIGLELGLDGLRDKVERYASQNKAVPEAEEFYAAERMMLDTMTGWIASTCAGIRAALAAERDPQLRANLEEMLAANEWVAHQPPRTLREACQFISWYNTFGRSYNREGCGGQLDEILRPYYERDSAAGRIDDEDAVYYIAGLLMSDTKYYQLGGPDEHGRDMVSRVSWLILEAAHRLNVATNLTIRVHDGLDEAFFRRGVELLFEHKNGWPRFSGDQSLVDGFVRRGFSPELARRRIAVGCNWMAIPGQEYPLNDCIKVNLARVFEVALWDAAESGAALSTDAIWQRFEHHLRIAVDTVARANAIHLKHNRHNSPELFLNLFVEGPIEKGNDASYIGTMPLYTIGIDGAGIAVAADSFAALRQRVEQEQALSWAQVLDALKGNYSGPDGPYIQALLKGANKFGQWDADAERWAARISQMFTSIVVAQQSPAGEVRFIPGLFSWSHTIAFGRTVGATPDGRGAGQPVNHGANPMPGSVKNGAMTTLSEAIAAVQCGMGNTCPFQMELDPGIVDTEHGVDKVMALLRTHLERGGTLINVNIVDADKILAAHHDPEAFPDLVVRVTGFTAYFASLSPEFRQLVVDRIVTAN